MAVQLKPLREQVMVITGASSGIGLATAREAARRGAAVVLAGRNEPALTRLAVDIRADGGQALPVVTDVSRRQDLEHLAAETIRHFGHFDTWVNNAGVGLFGPLSEVSEADHRRLFETNFWGLVNGSLIAAGHLRERGGAIINIGSVASDVTLPNLTMYSVTKHAVKGFTDGLRSELEADGAPVSVTLVKPASINTPFPQHARNYMPVEPKLPPPVYDAEEVARTICHAAERGGRDLFIGGGARMFSALRQHAPALVDRYTAGMALKQMDSGVPTEEPEGILEQTRQGGDEGGEEYGDMHGSPVRRTSLYSRAVRNPGITAGCAITLGLLTTGALIRRQRRP